MDSVFNLQRPYDLMALLKQEERAEMLENLKEELLSRKGDLDGSEDGDSGLWLSFIFSLACSLRRFSRFHLQCVVFIDLLDVLKSGADRSCEILDINNKCYCRYLIIQLKQTSRLMAGQLKCNLTAAMAGCIGVNTLTITET